MTRMNQQNLMLEAKIAIMRAEDTDKVSIAEMKGTLTAKDGMTEAVVTAFVDDDYSQPRMYTMYQHWWDGFRGVQRIDTTTPEAHEKFMEEYRHFKVKNLSSEALFALLQKANRRRIAAERKAKLKKQKAVRISEDAMTAVGSRQRTIEQQWEIMRELQRRKLVSMEDLEQVIKDVTKCPLPKWPEDK